jgi:2'-hydroxyisoflavone reductase
MNRRNFIKTISLMSASSLSSTTLAQLSVIDIGKNSGKKILILGGTNFIGPVIVEQLLKNGYEVSLFNRGITNPHLFPNLEKIRGDRYPSKGKGLSALMGARSWDVIIDTWAENPLCVRDTLALLKDRCQQYIYTSSMSVYPDHLLLNKPRITETESLIKDDIPKSYSDELSYGVNKRIADSMVRKFPHGCVLRPHSICGVNMDHTSDNQRYWPVRLQRGGVIAAPGDGADTTQYIDVKDLAAFVVTCIKNRNIGIYNTFTTERFDAYLYGLKALSSQPSELLWLPYSYLNENKLRRYVDMPMWAARQEVKGTFTISSEKAIKAGLVFRPLSDTFTDVLAGFYRTETNKYDFGVKQSKAGLSRNKEIALLKAYRG